MDGRLPTIRPANENLARLCCSIIEEQLGEIERIVVSELLNKGRLSLPQLTRFTNLRQSQVKAALIALMDLDLCTYKEQQEGPRGSAYYYSVNPDKIVYRMRYPFYLVYVADKYGPIGQDIFLQIILYGRRTFNSICDAIQSIHPDQDQVLAVFKAMTDAKEVQPTDPDDVKTNLDKRIEAEKVWKATTDSTMTARVREKMRKALDEEERKAAVDKTWEGLKRKHTTLDEDAWRQTKKTKTVNDLYVDDSLHWKINYDQFHVHLRNAAICDLAKRKIHPAASFVMKYVLDCCEGSMKSCKDDEKSVPIRQWEIRNHMNTASGLCITMYNPNFTSNGQQRSSRRYDSDDSDDGPSSNNKHDPYIKSANPETEFIDLLAKYNEHFQLLKKTDGTGQTEFIVPLKDLSTFMKLEIIRKTIREGFGEVGLRVWNALYMESKLDEKTISTLTMTQAKQVRRVLYMMLEQGFVHLQDVPKRLDHTSQNTFFLYYVSLDLVITNTIEKIYKSIANLKLRRYLESQRFTTTMERAELGEELSDDELKQLDVVKRMTENFKIAELRLDCELMVLKDF
ncbi:hypothetical protein SeMB42_g07936 [Synchytrium endobioticum]|uniref:DNA-directed RNA polymerase III subunit RPC3 n=1 Tax=Synchytrium endobioticum TaxID=286115 RepID=A0A507BS30_9FUNG|nr:hypothetical protein SeMB42_g07936 [Synchytrium endobioticum]TPX35200.1 hypothetical protein SeLEV6574_g08200 [Synchytrium endobioticum]